MGLATIPSSTRRW